MPLLHRSVRFLAVLALPLSLYAGGAQANLNVDADRSSPSLSQDGKIPMRMVSVTQPTFMREALLVPHVEGLSESEIWTDIDVSDRRLTVYRGQEIMLSVDHVAIGKSGVSSVRQRGSALTPTGEFRVDRINTKSKFRLFLGIDYPNAHVAEQALNQGIVTQAQHDQILSHLANYGVALPSTPLGGYIGIHGLGRSSAKVHQGWDWTDGCVAVMNDEILKIGNLVNSGDRVLIRR